MASHIIALVNNRKEYERIRRKGIEYAKRFTWKNFVDNYFAIYKQLVRA
jgi:glycosyltransferase involved in cell wall biosynthesis